MPAIEIRIALLALEAIRVLHGVARQGHIKGRLIVDGMRPGVAALRGQAVPVTGAHLKLEGIVGARGAVLPDP